MSSSGLTASRGRRTIGALPSASRTRRTLSVALALAALLFARPRAQDTPALEVLLMRAADYVRFFVLTFSDVVAEEQYEQSWRSFTRRVRSDFHLIQPKDAGGYIALRDVLTVDGTPVRDRDARLMKLLTTPGAGSAARISEVSKEGGRYSFGGVFNSPVVVHAFLQTAFQDHFRFTLGAPDRTIGPDVWTIAFTEAARPTLLRTDRGRDDPASGQAWLEARTGRILKTELLLSNDSIIATFRFDERFQIAVPVEMVDKYRYQNYTVNGTATYGRFLRYHVTTNEAVDTDRAAEKDAPR
jgi:hypothetical protein